ncbi:hypothetical protein HMPREF9166_2346 [Selenomonas sp. oral taxon 149 str. 67H29BP]|nr:ABC transporter ATP-binding protein [Selenomonas sp. oral taxon 149]EFM21990.1 hypothetical protein HMPREF9166_2346 [Selenomonas sp. oral taxon 149 str. 67H29BP]
MLLELKSVSCGYGEKAIFQDISFSVARGETLCLLGPNGVGKTTLLKTILGLLPPMAGEILLSGENISAWTVEERARRIAYVPQMHTPPFPFTVHDVVVMGRAAHISSFGIPGKRIAGLQTMRSRCSASDILPKRSTRRSAAVSVSSSSSRAPSHSSRSSCA